MTYSSSERLDDGVVSSGRLGGSEPDPGLIGTEENVVVRQTLHDAVERSDGDQGVGGAGIVELDTLEDPLDIEVLAFLKAGRAMQGNTVVQLLETDRVPVLGSLVTLHELDGTQSTVDLKSLVTVESPAFSTL